VGVVIRVIPRCRMYSLSSEIVLARYLRPFPSVKEPWARNHIISKRNACNTCMFDCDLPLSGFFLPPQTGDTRIQLKVAVEVPFLDVLSNIRGFLVRSSKSEPDLGMGRMETHRCVMGRRTEVRGRCLPTKCRQSLVSTPIWRSTQKPLSLDARSAL
jgi:hypothetical protein